MEPFVGKERKQSELMRSERSRSGNESQVKDKENKDQTNLELHSSNFIYNSWHSLQKKR